MRNKKPCTLTGTGSGIYLFTKQWPNHIFLHLELHLHRFRTTVHLLEIPQEIIRNLQVSRAASFQEMAPSLPVPPPELWVMRGAMEQISGEPLCSGGWMLCDARRRFFGAKSDPIQTREVVTNTVSNGYKLELTVRSSFWTVPIWTSNLCHMSFLVTYLTKNGWKIQEYQSHSSKVSPTVPLKDRWTTERFKRLPRMSNMLLKIVDAILE